MRSLARVSRLVERASADLSLPDYRILCAVVEGEARASRMAARLAIGKPAISARVDSLCRSGLLVRSQAEGDQRATELSITPQGLAAFEAAEAQMADRLDTLCAQTPEPASTVAALSALGEATETMLAAHL